MASNKLISIVDDINRRVTLVIALVAILAVGLNYWVSVRDARTQVDERADEVIAAIIEAFRLPFWDHSLSHAMEIATAFSANEWVVYVRVKDASGHLVAGVGWRNDAAVFRDAKILYGERLVGSVLVGLTLRPLDKQIHHAVLNSLLMLVAVVLALYLFNRILLRRGLQRPVRLMLERVDSIAAGHYDAPVQEIRHHEIRTLVQQFDAMARQVEQRERSLVDANAQLHAAQAALREHGEGLERVVAERTRELQAEIGVRQQTEVELRHATLAAEAANRAKSNFVAQMSHELRTPLNGVLGCTRIMRNDPQLSPQQREALDTVRDCGEHLLALINDILDIAKIEAGRMELDDHEFSLPRLLHSLDAMFRPRAHDKGLAFVLSADAELPELVSGDARKLRQVLFNLLDNAIKFTTAGCIELQVRRSAAMIRFEIVDTGPGIPPEWSGELFQPFAQMHLPSRGSSPYSAPRHEGTGLGLAISQRLTQLMGGALAVQSEPGAGCRFAFEITLPAIDSAVLASGRQEQVIVGYRGRALRVLITDDERVNRKVLTGLLAPIGFQCADAIDGEDCLSQAMQVRPDVILMDIQMPRVDGLAATRRLHALPGFAQLPVIAVSANAGCTDRLECLEAGCVEFIAQPINIAVLLDALARCLDIEWVLRGADDEQHNAAPTRADLVPLPDSQATALRAAARKGHVKGITEQVRALDELGGRFAATAQHIRELARQFRFDEIAALAER